MNKVKIIIIGLLIISANIVKSQTTDNEIIAAFKKSYEYEQYKDYDKAITELTKLYNQKSYEINLRLGWLTYSKGSYVKSMSYYKKAIEINPASIEARFGFIYPAAAAENWTLVKSQYEAILTIDSKNSAANYRIGYMYYYASNYSKAKDYLARVLLLYPFDYDAIILQAWTNLKLGNTTDARELFNKALMYNPGSESALEGLKLLK